MSKTRFKQVSIFYLQSLIGMLVSHFIPTMFFWYWIVLSLFIGHLINTRNYLEPKQTKGCLHGKTEAMKNEFFESIYNFIESDLIFYNEQVSDLLEDEKEQFNCWIFDNKYTK